MEQQRYLEPADAVLGQTAIFTRRTRRKLGV
jgi:hypothetical protein